MLTRKIRLCVNIIQSILKEKKINGIICMRHSARYSSETTETIEKCETEWKPSKYENIPVSNIRNFSIIAHIDHGKSTLADRILEMTGTEIQPGTAQVLDRLQVEKERGITVKAVTASLRYRSKIDEQEYLLNLVDTPGHVDFNNEVSRSLEACQAVVLLIDAHEGVQAQTYANFHLAFFKNLTVIPVLNKIDMKTADPERVEKQLKQLFDIDTKNVLRISAKFGTGVDNLLEEIIARSPQPPSNRDAPLKAFLFDSWFEQYNGTVILLYLLNGCVKEGDVIMSHQSKLHYVVKHVGVVTPNQCRTGVLKAGQIGFVACNMRSTAEALIGDTFYHKHDPVEPFPGFKPTQPIVFAGLYPVDPSQHTALNGAIEKLILTDSAVTVIQETCAGLGLGWRLGFLGLLHLEVFNQRLEQEYDAQAVMTSPTVTYKVTVIDTAVKKFRSKEMLISNPLNFPERKLIERIEEPIVLGTIMTPVQYVNDITSLCLERRGEQKNITYIDNARVVMQFLLPLSEIMVDFHDKLKTATSGFASFNYEDNGYMVSNLVKVDILLNGKCVEELCMVLHNSKLLSTARKVCIKLTEIIPRQQFKIAIQAAVGTKIIARENINAYRKDVLAKLHACDISRKQKLLARQAEGKRRLREIGNIQIPRDTFIQLLKR